MRIRGLTTVLLTLGMGAVLASPTHARTRPQATVEAHKAPLKDRVQDAVDRYQSAGTRPSLDELAALSLEADEDPGLDPGLRADLATMYAYTLARNKRPEQSIAVIIAAQVAHGTQDKKMGDLLLAEAVFEDFIGLGNEALATRQKALSVYIEALGPDDVLVATTRVQIAFSLFARGQLGDALDLYAAGLPVMAGDDGVVRVYATQMANYANALRLSGNLDEALKTGRAALDVARASLPAGHAATLYSLDNVGITLMELGRYAEAETVLRDAVDTARATLGSASVETLGFTYHLAQVLALEGRREDAESLLREALINLEGVNTGQNPDLPGLMLLELAHLARDRGDFAAARKDLETGLAAIADSGQTGAMTRARIQVQLGEVLLLQGDRAAAEAGVAATLPFYRDNLPAFAPDRISAEMLHALILAREGKADQAYEDAGKVISVLTARLDSDGQTRADQAQTVRAYARAFAHYADIALSAGHPDTAFAAAQRAALTEVSTTSQGLAARAASADPRVRELARSLQINQELRSRLDRQRTYALARSTEEVKKLDGQIAAVELTLRDVSTQLTRDFPAYAALSHPAPVTVAAAQASLGRKQAIIMPVSSPDRLITLVLSKGGMSWDAQPLGSAVVNDNVARLRATISSGLADSSAAFDRAPAWELGQAIFTPSVMKALSGREELAVVGSGPLMTVPFGLLLTAAPKGSDHDASALRDSAWLIRKFAVAVKPAFISGASAPASAKGFLGVGAPVLGSELDGFASRGDQPLDGDKATVADVELLRRLPGLPRAKDELIRMLDALSLPHSKLLTGADATETRVKAMPLDDYAVIAFATHGLVSGNLQTLREPALVLTPPVEASEGDDGLLTASDVAGLKLNARWVILSACNTGSGREDGAAGYSGLARAFMQAGAQSLMVSLWPVRDDAADRLAVATVENNARGASQAQALRRATLDLMKDKSVKGSANPAIWAPFSLVVQ